MDEFEQRGDDGGIRWLVATGLETRGVFAAFTERTGGVSAPPFDSLNLGVKDGDDPGVVLANREAVCEALGIPPFAVAEQVHGARVADVDADEAGAGFEWHAFEGCDALTTRASDVPLAILTADCVPVALADDDRVTAVHVGWRGARSGILQWALEGFARPDRVRAAIGPAIRACHYEVGEDVIGMVGLGLRADPVSERRAGAWYLDLAATVAAALRRAGVDDVADCGLCTACETDRYFSYRRDGETGRQALLLVRP